ncbi:PHD and RING finger domain-containing protein C126.07c-like isoform X2 [Hibiscus syriacus]|uniref:PHD and RING finger domain-containing protein C126.07c-like isoform X2 n=1 Tax=Hibiscus syriacus TaxID=106335 RepID=UPI0019230E88|nr:PHD and RING finger domain-containing protein C126.07c-like isoform X2 [Hibiscus syriacus]
MEWAKVESRCPMCKRRFTAIPRPPKESVFASGRLVNIPQRDQVYHLSVNATSRPSDPYAEVRCSVCHGMTDESLLLLCDLCDSTAHMYCVGLGDDRT